jgi:putative peptide zinc metalloprotease protein
VKAGTKVKEGDELAVLQNPELQLRLVDLQGRQREAEAKLRNLSLRSRDDEALKAQFETQQEVIDSLRDLEEKTRDEISRLVVIAKRPGVVWPPPNKDQQATEDGRLPTWSGSPLDQRNVGALLTAEDLICEIGAENELEAVLIVDQGDVQLVDVGQPVDLKLESYRIGKFSGMIAEKSQTEIRNTSASLAIQAGGDLQTEIDPETGQPKPRSVSYQARVPLVDVDQTLRAGYRGMAKIHTAPMSLGQRLWRFVSKTFNFEL